MNTDVRKADIFIWKLALFCHKVISYSIFSFFESATYKFVFVQYLRFYTCFWEVFREYWMLPNLMKVDSLCNIRMEDFPK